MVPEFDKALFLLWWLLSSLDAELESVAVTLLLLLLPNSSQRTTDGQQEWFAGNTIADTSNKSKKQNDRYWIYKQQTRVCIEEGKTRHREDCR